MNNGTGPVEERFHPRIWRRAMATRVATEIDGAEALKRLPAGQDLWMRVEGRMRKPAAQKFNPLWWAVNDWDKVPPENSITKLEDLALICANCHRMIHAQKPWLSVEELRAILR